MGYLLLGGLAYFSAKYCLIPIGEAILRIIDPDDEGALRVEEEEIMQRLGRSDNRLTLAANQVRILLGLHQI